MGIALFMKSPVGLQYIAEVAESFKSSYYGFSTIQCPNMTRVKKQWGHWNSRWPLLLKTLLRSPTNRENQSSKIRNIKYALKEGDVFTWALQLISSNTWWENPSVTLFFTCLWTKKITGFHFRTEGKICTIKNTSVLNFAPIQIYTFDLPF